MFNPKIVSTFDYHDEIVYYYPVKSLKQSLGWSVQRSSCYFEYLLEKYNEIIWSTLDWGKPIEGGEYYWYQVLNEEDTIMFLETYYDEFPKRLKHKGDYYTLACQAYDWLKERRKKN